MFSAGGMALAPFVIFAHVDEPELLARVEPPFNFADGNFADARPGVLAEIFKSFRMLHHYSSDLDRFLIAYKKEDIDGARMTRTGAGHRA
jgi:hypothetical protein